MCVMNCETQDAAASIYRADYWATATTCIKNASCTDTLNQMAAPKCFSAAAAATPADSAVVAFCSAYESIVADAGCLSGDCLSTYNIVNDTAVMALTACLGAPSFCGNPDAGASCFANALKP